MNQPTVNRAELEDFIYREADLADDWQLEQWLALWAPGPLLYEIGPLDTTRGDRMNVNEAMFLLSDDRFRLEQRIVRLGKPTAHAETPVRSRLRHSYTHLRDIQVDGSDVNFRVNLLLTRTRRDAEGVAVIPGYVTWRLVRADGALRIREKRIFLDLHVLSRPGTLAFII